MTESITKPGPTQMRTSPQVRYGVPLTLLLLLIAAFFAYRALKNPQTPTVDPATGYLTAGELEERYGLSVRLIGVTAGGGMVDFRLKIHDVEKAREFLQNPANLPRLIAAESGDALVGTQGLEDDVSWEEGGILFILFSNSGGLIEPGTPVSVEFGDVQLEPIPAQ